MPKQVILQGAVLLLYCSWLVVRPFSPRASKALLLTTNFATALAVIIYMSTPLQYVLEDWRLQATVACELLAAVAAVGAFYGNRLALFVSYLVFAAHVSAILWFITHPIRIEHVLDYG